MVGRKSFTTFTGSDPPFLQLTDVGPEFHVAGVDRLHHGVGLVAGLDARAGVLVQDADDADAVERLGNLVQRLDDVGLVLGEHEGRALDVVRTDAPPPSRRTS